MLCTSLHNMTIHDKCMSCVSRHVFSVSSEFWSYSLDFVFLRLSLMSFIVVQRSNIHCFYESQPVGVAELLFASEARIGGLGGGRGKKGTKPWNGWGRICAGEQFSTSCTVSQLGDGGVSIPPRSILWWMVCGGLWCRGRVGQVFSGRAGVLRDSHLRDLGLQFFRERVTGPLLGAHTAPRPCGPKRRRTSA